MLFVSCKNPLNFKQEAKESQKAYISISANLPGSNARTVLPTVVITGTTGLTWKLTGEKIGSDTPKTLGFWSDTTDNASGNVTTAFFNMCSDTNILLDVGNWKFTLTVYNNYNKKVLEATLGDERKAFEITKDGQNKLDFVMQEATGENLANGQIEFKLNFPENVVGKVKATLYTYPDSGNPVESNESGLEIKTETDVDGNFCSCVVYKNKNDLAPGYYKLNLALQQKMGTEENPKYETITTYSCIIRVAPGLLSSGIYELTSLAKLYPVTFDLKGGRLDENIPTNTVTYNKYQKIDLPTPKNDGFEFLGWCTDSSCNNPVQLDENGKFSITEGITLYAKWQEVSIPFITLGIKENVDPNNSEIIEKTDCIGISVKPNSESESVWTYYGTVSPTNSSQGYTFQKGDNKVSIQMKASEKTVVAIAAARADMFFTVDTEWKTFEFNTGYLNEELTKAITIGVGLSKEVYFRNLTVTQTQTATEKTINNTLPTLSFDINKTGIQEYLNSENSNPIIQVRQVENGYSIEVQASANNFDLSIRSYATHSQLNKVNFTLQNVSDTTLTSSLLGFSVKENEVDNSSDVNDWSKNVTYKDENNIVFPAFSNDGSSDLVPCVIQGIVDTGLEYNNSLSFSLLNFSSSPIESLEGTGKVFAIKTGPDDNQNWQQTTKLDDFSLEIASHNKSVLQVVITDAFKGEELVWDSNSYYCQFINYKKGSEGEDIIKLDYNEQDKFVTIDNESESKINCTVQIDSNFNVVISATVQPAIPESGLALQIGTDGEKDKIYVYNKTGLENLRNLVNGTIDGTLTVGIYEKTNTFNYDSSEGGYSDFNAILLNDIELDSTVEWTPIGTEDYPYIGTFDGNGKTVSGMNITQEANKVGFFYATNGATIKDLTIQGKIEFDGQRSYSYIGGFAGYSEGTSYSNCINKVKITYKNYGYSYIGGLVGQIKNCNFTNCINLAEISVSEYVGGIVGVALADSSNTFEKCINSGSLIASSYAGGIIGYNRNCKYTIKNCLNLADIGDEDETANQLSGIIGPGDSSINCEQEVSYCLNLGKLKGSAHLYPITSYEKSDDEKNYYDCTKNPSVDEEYGAVGKETSDLKIGNSFDESWSEDNWSFANGRYPLPNIGKNIPEGEAGVYWRAVLTAAEN